MPETPQRKQTNDAMLKERERQMGEKRQILGADEKTPNDEQLTKGQGYGKQRFPADDQGGLRKRQSDLSDIHKEHERRVGIERQMFSEDPDAPDDFRKACKEDEHILNKIGKIFHEGRTFLSLTLQRL